VERGKGVPGDARELVGGEMFMSGRGERPMEKDHRASEKRRKEEERASSPRHLPRSPDVCVCVCVCGYYMWLY
jgi:hypothetical protein